MQWSIDRQPMVKLLDKLLTSAPADHTSSKQLVRDFMQLAKAPLTSSALMAPDLTDVAKICRGSEEMDVERYLDP